MRPAELLRPELTELNRLGSRPPLEPYDTAARARTGAGTKWRRSLDGRWRFRLVDQPDDAPARWTAPSTDDGRWRTIEVPGCWTRQGTGDEPVYTNVQMPWPELETGEVPSPNPTGLYRTRFTVPKSWRRRDVVLHIGAAESMAVVWCNGELIGMGTDSRLPSEFDLTAHLVDGENLLAVMVVRYHPTTWIEDQDHWFHAGIHRSVHVEARSRNRIDDLSITADYDASTGAGRAEISARVKGHRARSVRVTLETLRGRRLATTTTEVPRIEGANPTERWWRATLDHGPVSTTTIDVPDVRPWSAEDPHCYRVLTELVDDTDRVIEAHATITGFRRVEVRDRRLLVNDRPVMIHGVNRHDHHPVTGKTLTVDELRDELSAMKRHNINAVRTAHYPNDHRLLDLCDELGLYVVDEANCEGHARAEGISRDPRFTHAIVERSRRMVLRDRNHPSIIGWSLGNETGGGDAFDMAAAWIRRIDPSRFVQYEGVLYRHTLPLLLGTGPHEAPSRSERLVTDVLCPMYTPIHSIVAWAEWAERTELDDRPLILCEFSHAMGNSNGSISEYVDAFYGHAALGGGFVWDWRDQGLAEHDDAGRPYWAYGGHFGEPVHDGNFCINGLVGPDLEPHPGLDEYRWAIRPVTVEHVDRTRVRVANRRVFTSTADLILGWELAVDGAVVESGDLDVDVEPGSSRVISIPARHRARPGTETHLTLRWTTRRAGPWARRGHLVAWDQIDLTPEPVKPTPPSTGRARCRLELSDHGIEGVWVSDRPLVLGDIIGTLWRAPTDNEGVMGPDGEPRGLQAAWRQAGLDQPRIEVDDITTSRTGATISIRRRLVFAEHEARHDTTIRVGDHLTFREQIEVPEPFGDLPRVGVRFEIPASLDRLEWLGLGPHETYPDRRASGLVGRWRSTVTDQYHPFVVPQEHGAHLDTRWFTLTDARGRGLVVSAPSRFAFSARSHHDADLAAATTVAELHRSENTEVHIDAALRGLGTGACGPDTLAPYRVGPGSHTLTWSIGARA